jgi:predicted MPP superfamily phosphohydrolase
VAADAWWWEPGRLVVERHRVRLPRLPNALDGLRVAQLTDFHCGSLVSDDHLQLYTNRGVGCITPPIRLNCPPEIALFELHGA